ncbi:MAG: hypothetical protein K6A63_04280 [Acholeplasmatales bacterium]|nr:hypothetical protein [Acholeplasmatales bacterium]
MKRRQYAIIIEEGNTQRVEEINIIKEAKELIQAETYGYFWNEEDALPGECIDTNNYRGIKEYLLWLNKNNHQYIEIYCDVLSKLSRIKHLRQLRHIVDSLNRMLIGIDTNVRIYLNSRKYDGCGWCGKEE